MSRLDRAERMLRRRRRQSYAVLGSYVITDLSGGPYRIEIPMTLGDTRIETDNGEVIATSRVSDFIVDIADMVYVAPEFFSGFFDGFFDDFFEDSPAIPKTRMPAAGDMIIFRGEVYTVAPIGGGRPYQPHGRDGKSYRIHTAVTTVRSAHLTLEQILALEVSSP